MRTWKQILIGLTCIVALTPVLSAYTSRDPLADAYECMRAGASVGGAIARGTPAGNLYIACMHVKGYGQGSSWEIYKNRLLQDD